MGQYERTDNRRFLFGSAVVLLAALVVVMVVVTFPSLRTPQQVAAEAVPPRPAPITATVEKRTLSTKVVTRASVVPGATVDLKPGDSLSAAGMVITAIPSAAASTIQAGTVLLEANGEPLIAMNWPFPAYRDIHAGDSGPDVVQLQKTLGGFGYATGQAGLFDNVTRSGLRQLYRDLGYVAPLAEAGSGASSGSKGAPYSDASGSRSREPATAVTPSSEVQKEVFLPARDVVIIPGPSSTLTSIPLKVGDKIGPETILARLDGQARTVVASTTPERSATLAAGALGTLSGTSGEQYAVKVASIAPNLGDVPGLGQGIRIDLEFADIAQAAPETANGATLKLEIPTGSAVTGLALPITAIYSTQDGTSYVIPESAPEKRVEVTIGVNIDGWVEIKPGTDLKEGEAVVLGTRE